LIERAAFVGTISAADNDIVDVYSVGLTSIAQKVIITDRPEVVHRRAVMKKSVAAIVGADRRPPHDVSVVVDESPWAGVSGNGSKIAHPVDGIPNESAMGPKARAGLRVPCYHARIINAEGFCILTPERAEIAHPVAGIPDEGTRIGCA
jgi:hypothetical protein